MYIYIGTVTLKSQRVTTTAAWAVEKESEKALQIRETVTVTRNRNGSVASQDERAYWLPKSQITRHGDFIRIPDWLAKEKSVWGFGICPMTDGRTVDPAGLEDGSMYIQADREYYPADHPDVAPDADSFMIGGETV